MYTVTITTYPVATPALEKILVNTYATEAEAVSHAEYLNGVAYAGHLDTTVTAVVDYVEPVEPVEPDFDPLALILGA